MNRLMGPLGFIGVSCLMLACSSSSSDDSTAPAADGTGTGPGSSMLCTSSGKDAWETYGAPTSGAAFVKVNESIFTLVLADTTGKLGGSFAKIGTGNPPSTSHNLAAFKGNLAAFLVFAYGGPSSTKYTDGVTYVANADLKTLHAGLAITADQYNYFITSIVVPALTMNGVTMADVSSCFAPLVTSASVMAEIVGQ